MNLLRSYRLIAGCVLVTLILVSKGAGAFGATSETAYAGVPTLGSEVVDADADAGETDADADAGSADADADGVGSDDPPSDEPGPALYLCSGLASPSPEPVSGGEVPEGACTVFVEGTPSQIAGANAVLGGVLFLLGAIACCAIASLIMQAKGSRHG